MKFCHYSLKKEYVSSSETALASRFASLAIFKRKIKEVIMHDRLKNMEKRLLISGVKASTPQLLYESEWKLSTIPDSESLQMR